VPFSANRSAVAPAGPRAPLVPIALAVTAGIVADRVVSVPVSWAAVFAALGLVAWIAALRSSNRSAPAWLMITCAALASLHHHQYQNVFRADDIGQLASSEPRLTRLRGVLSDEPELHRLPRNPLRSIPRPDSTRSEIEVTEVEDHPHWRP